MKTVKTALLLMAATLCWACSGTDDTADAAKTGGSTSDAEGNGYIALQINAAEYGLTRGFEDGTTEEKRVGNAYLLLFSGSSEATATLASVWKLGTGTSGSTSTQIEAQQAFVTKVSRNNVTDNVYAFAILNAYDGLISGYTEGSPDITIGGTTLSKASKLSNLQNIQLAAVKGKIDGSAEDYFLMTSAPVSNVAGGLQASAPSGTVSVMPQVIIYNTEAEAKANTPARIFVERAAAKVTVSVDNTITCIVGELTVTIDPSADVDWTLDLENQNTYLSRHFKPDWLMLTATTGVGEKDYRFADATAITGTAFRTYWAEDPNYDSKANLAVPKTVATATWDSKDTYYTLENTFDYDKQTTENATALLVRVRLNGGYDYYTIGDDPTMIYQVITEEGTDAHSSFAPRRSSYLATSLVFDGIKKWLWYNSSDLQAWLQTNYLQYDAGDWEKSMAGITVTLENHDAAGTAEVTSIVQTITTDATAAAAFNALGLVTKANDADTGLKLKYYKDGYCYYRGPIMHFGQTATPWTSGGYTENGHLGRYGIVRDHLYKLTIHSFVHVGSPIIPAPTSNRID